jgi:hypothetical protein
MSASNLCFSLLCPGFSTLTSPSLTSGHGLRVSVVLGSRVLFVCAVGGEGKAFKPPLARSWAEAFVPDIGHRCALVLSFFFSFFLAD